MTPNHKAKLVMHSSCFIGNPMAKLSVKGFSTFHSLQHRKNADHHANDTSTPFVKTCKKEFEMIQSMSKRLWLNDSSTLKVEERNMNDLLHLIQRQKQISEVKERLGKKQKRGSVNETCMKIYESIKGNQGKEGRFSSLPLNNSSKRSRSIELAKQPTKVTIFKKLIQFNKHQHLDRMFEEKNRSLNLNVPRFTPKVSLLSPLQAPSLPKDPKRLIQCQKDELPMLQVIQRQQSIQCKGQILGKQDETKKRRNRMRHLNLIQRSILNRPHQPIFLQQV